jgi:(p)ppGpp synthase/HD superfamily hydrolase
MLLKSVTNDEDVIIAGIMHDALEDVADYEYEHLERDCGVRVAKIVQGVTENKTLPYRERKIDYLEKLKVGMVESVLVSVADKLHNAMSLKDVHASHDMNVDTQKKIYNEVLNIGKERLNNAHGEVHPLVVELERVLESI